MIWFKRCLWTFGAFCTVLSSSSNELKAATNELKFDEVFSLIKSNATELSPSELESRAAAALLREFSGRIQLANPNGENTNSASSSTNLVSKKAIYNENHGYIRIARIEAGASESFKTNYQSLQSTNKSTGLVLDLRFSSGQDYAEAAKIADAFLATEKPLLKVGTTNLNASTKTDAINLPLVVLVNSETTGAPEALAALIRQNERGIIIGSPTAGQARIFEDYTLSTGQKLRVGRAVVELADGKPLAGKVQPDLAVLATPQEERLYLEDPFKLIPRMLNGTNRLGTNTLASVEGTNRARRLFNEAELVRRHREGTEFDPNAPAGPTAEESKMVIHDPALARGLDFLKGLSVLQQFRGSTK